MAIVLPHTFHDGTLEIASGVQVMENLQTLKAVLDAGWTGSATWQGAPAWGVLKGSDASILASSGDFTTKRNSAGVYEVKWTKARPNANYAVVANGLGEATTNPAVEAITAASFILRFTNFLGAAIDATTITFMALGVGEVSAPVALPWTFHDGVAEVASAKKLNEQLEALKAIEKTFAGGAYSGAPSWGDVNADGTINASSGGFTVEAKVAGEAGHYRIKWTTPRASANYAPIFTRAPGANPADHAMVDITAITAESVTFYMLKGPGAVGADTAVEAPFAFIALGGPTAAVNLPYTFHDVTGEIGLGTQVMANLNVLREALERSWAGGALHGAPSWGVLTGAGAVSAGSGDYVVERFLAGQYLVTWNTPRANSAYAVVLGVRDGSIKTLMTSEHTTTGFRIAAYNENALAVDTPLSFLVLGAG